MKVKQLSAVSFGHFSIDMLNASIAMWLTSAAGLYDLSVSQIGFGAMVYMLAAALTQPLFGALADRLRGRWLTSAGLLWTSVFFAIAPFMPSYATLIACLAVAALGSGALHPTGIVHASAAGGRLPTTATSIFFVSGQTGLALGPLIAGILIQSVGMQIGMPIMALSMLPAVVVSAWLLRKPIEDDSTERSAQALPSVDTGQTSSTSSRSRGLYVAVAFILLIALRAATVQSFAVLLPKYFDDLGYSPAVYGAILTVFIFGGAMGTFSGGFLGDMFNRRIVIFIATVASVPFLLGMLNSVGFVLMAAAAVAGAFLNIPHSILLVMAQQFLPARKGFMGGAVLGFMFASGAVAAWLASLIADVVGLETVLLALAVLPIGAGIFALMLPSTRKTVLTTERDITTTPASD